MIRQRALYMQLFFFLIVGLLIGVSVHPPSLWAQEIEPLQIVVSLHWSPDGQRLLVTGRAAPDKEGVWLYDAFLTQLQFFSTADYAHTGWSPDGSRFFIADEVFDAQNFQVVFSLKGNISRWSSDGSEIFTVLNAQSLGIFNAKSGDLVRQIPIGEMLPDALSWSPNDEYLLFVQPTGQSEIRSTTDGRLITTLKGEFATGLSWSPDSRYLAGSTVEIVEPGTPGILPDTPSPTLASVKIWDVITGEIVEQFSGLLAQPTILRWHPYKPELTAASGPGIIYVWNVETGDQLHVFTPLYSLKSVEYSPFGGRLIIGANSLRQNVSENQKRLVPQEAYWMQSIVDNALQVIVLDPSIEKLKGIENVCLTQDTKFQSSLSETLTTDMAQLTSYIEAVSADKTIPSGCSADLIAVAEALQAEQEGR